MSWAERIKRTASAKAVAICGLALAALLAAPATALGLGSLSGTVTAAVGGQPLAGIEVCAESVGVTDIRECVSTGPDGKYKVEGLEPGNYKVGFRPSVVSGYLSQFYNGKGTSGEADLVFVVSAADIFGIDAALLEEELLGGGGTVPPVTSTGDSTLLAAPLPVVTPPVVAAPKSTAKTCRKGWRKVRVKGQLRCRKIPRSSRRR